MASECESLAKQVIERARETGVTVGTAESLTGGMICASLTSVPGSSEVVAGGIASYMVRIKEDVLGVPASVIENDGVVSEPCAAHMAVGAQGRLDVDVAVSVTGVAGPGGGTPQTPVGTVCFGLAVRGAEPYTQTLCFDGDRAAVREHTTRHALELLLKGIATAQQ